MTVADYIILAVVVLCAVIAVVMIKKGKTGGCSGDCQRCKKNCK